MGDLGALSQSIRARVEGWWRWRTRGGPSSPGRPRGLDPRPSPEGDPRDARDFEAVEMAVRAAVARAKVPRADRAEVEEALRLYLSEGLDGRASSYSALERVALSMMAARAVKELAPLCRLEGRQGASGPSPLPQEGGGP